MAGAKSKRDLVVSFHAQNVSLLQSEFKTAG